MARYWAKICSLCRKRSRGVSFSHSCHSSGISSNVIHGRKPISAAIPRQPPPITDYIIMIFSDAAAYAITFDLMDLRKTNIAIRLSAVLAILAILAILS